MFDGLVGLHPTRNEPVGILADRWEISADKVTYTYHLNPASTWSDGTPVTSADFQFYYDTIMNPKHLTSLFRVGLSRFSRPEIIDDKTFLIRAKEVHWSNFWEASSMFAFPKHLWQEQDFNSINFEFETVTGPYQIYDIKTNRSISLQRRGDWWGRSQAFNQHKYNFDYLVFRSLADRVKALELLKRGDFDLYPIYTARIWAQQTQFSQVKKNWVIRQEVYNQEPKGYQGFAINMRKAPFDNRNLRIALTHLLNREMMQEKIMFNAYFLLNNYYPDLYPENKNPDAPFYGYNPEQARTLLKEAGWEVNSQGILEKDGTPLKVVLLYHGTPLPQLTIYIEDLRQVGIDASIEIVSLATYRKRLDQHEFDLAWQNWGATRLRNPEAAWSSKTADDIATQNISGVRDPLIDRLIEQQKTILVLDDRNKIVKQIDKRLTEIVPYVLLWQSDKHRLLYWNRFGTPKYILDKYNREESALVYWWLDPEKADQLNAAMRENLTLPAEPEVIRYP
jgi:microcin C transport system substrate-binding protein